MKPLHAERELIVQTLRGSTTHRAQELADKAGAWLLAWEGRADAGRKAAEDREQANITRVLRMAGTLRVDHSWVATVAQRFARAGEPVPAPETLRKALAARKAWNTEPSSTPALGSTQQSTATTS